MKSVSTDINVSRNAHINKSNKVRLAVHTRIKKPESAKHV